jgi:hypothetical protein
VIFTGWGVGGSIGKGVLEATAVVGTSVVGGSVRVTSMGTAVVQPPKITKNKMLSTVKACFIVSTHSYKKNSA